VQRLRETKENIKEAPIRGNPGLKWNIDWTAIIIVSYKRCRIPLSTSSGASDLTNSLYNNIYQLVVKVIPKYCRDIKIGDRILEINGVKAFNFQSAARADELFDTLYLVYYDKDEAEKQKQKHNDAQRLSSEGQARQRKGRRSRFEEEARQIGARRQDEKNRWERKLKEIEEEEELKRAESELRRLELRRRRAEEEARKSPSPPQAPTRRSSISVETNLGTFSPTPSRGFVKGGWSKISSNHKRNG
jgi:flagellar biosynthesis GTPase FlhF